MSEGERKIAEDPSLPILRCNFLLISPSFVRGFFFSVRMPLDNRLRDAMITMERTFCAIDSDGGGVVSFDALSRQLARKGFHDVAKLEALFAKVDRNKTGK